ncbi:unnamed protein product, partial [Chrysoparadoxa australica]
MVVDMRQENAQLQERLSELSDREKKARSTLRKLQLMSVSQTALLRNSLTKNLKDRDQLMTDLLAAVSDEGAVEPL